MIKDALDGRVLSPFGMHVARCDWNFTISDQYIAMRFCIGRDAYRLATGQRAAIIVVPIDGSVSSISRELELYSRITFTLAHFGAAYNDINTKNCATLTYRKMFSCGPPPWAVVCRSGMGSSLSPQPTTHRPFYNVFWREWVVLWEGHTFMGKIPAELRATVAHNIRVCRMHAYPGRGGSKKCAEAIGVSQQQWSQWERGNRVPDEQRMKQIAGFFGKTVEDLRRDNDSGEEASAGAPSPTSFDSSSVFPLHPSPPIAGLDYPAPASWQSPTPGSPESFFWLARHFVALLEAKEIRIDKQCLTHLAKLIKPNADNQKER